MNRTAFRPVDPARSRLVVIGTPRYRDERLPDVPAIAHNVADLAAAFTDPELGGFTEGHCRTVPAAADLPQAGDILTTAAEQAGDLLLVSYSGHGLIDRRGKPYLSLAATRPDRPASYALSFEAVRETFLDSRADNRVLILDSCFSGRAIGRPLAAEAQSLLSALEVSGSYTLTAATANRVALALDGERHTAFTERLLRLFQNGSPTAGQMPTPADTHRHLHAQLTAEGLPVPQQRGTDTAGQLGLVRNRQGLTARQFLVRESLPVLVNAAVTGRTATAGASGPQPPGGTAAAEGRATPPRAGRRGGGRRAGPPWPSPRPCRMRTGGSPFWRMSAVVVATADIFRGINMLINGHEPYRTTAPADIVRNHGLRDPKDGEYVLDTYLLRGPRPPRRADAVSETARAVAAFAPDRAEEIAAGIAEEPSRANALAGIALVVAAAGLDRALEIIAVVGDPALGQAALADVAPAVAAHDFQRAVQLTEAVTGTLWKVFALTGIASVHLDTRHRRPGATGLAAL